MPTLTTQQGWEFGATPTIAIALPNPTTATMTGAWNTGTKTLLVTTADATIAQGTAVSFTVADTVTPSGTVIQNTVTINTQDSTDVLADGTGGGQTGDTEEITEGALSDLSFVTTTDTPGVSQLSTVSFTTVGQLLAGAKVKVIMPTLTTQQGWEFGATPTIAIALPNPTTATMTGAWNTGTKTLLVTTADATIAQGTAVSFTVADTVTPSGTVIQNTVTINTQDSTDVLAD